MTPGNPIQNLRGKLAIFLMIADLVVPAASRAGDWPQFLGPSRNGVYEGSALTVDWPSGGPPLVWKKAVGHGFSGPVVVNSKLIVFQRLADQETVSCLDARTGNSVWSFAYPTSYVDDFGFDDGPRATPNVMDRHVYTFGAQGMLHCLDLETGKKLWSVDVKNEFDAGNGFFGMACSPLVEGKAVILNIGGAKGAGIVAFDKDNGKLLWKTSDEEASYSSPIAATLGGRRYVLFLTRNDFVALDPVAGEIRFQYPWHSRNRMSVNAASPVVIGDGIFLSASYATGAVLLRLGDQGIQKIWSSDDLLSNHYATSVEFNGFLYGIHGRTDPGFSPRPSLRCVELKTQKVRWETDSIGAATITRAGSQLLVLTDKGELVGVLANPDNFQPKGRAQILTGEVRAFPAMADGFLFARNKDQLVCVDLRRANEK
jgi:outer membrane protein assembly factor BamB